MRHAFLFIFHALIAHQMEGQVHRITLGTQVGEVMEIYPGFPQTHAAFGWDGSWTRQGDSTHAWEAVWRFPETGISFLYTNLGNADTLGFSISMMYRFFLRQQLSKKWMISEGLDLGFAWYNLPFDVLENPGNIAVGSSLSAAVRLSVNVLYQLSGRFELYAGVSFYHASNGHTGLPNVGVNIPYIQAGAKHCLNPEKAVPSSHNSSVQLDRSWRFAIRGGYGINRFGNEVGPTNGPYYPMYLVSFSALKRVSSINRISIALEGYYNTGYREFLESQDLGNIKASFINSCVGMVIIGNEFLIGRLGIITQIGYNFHNPFLRYYSKEVSNEISASKIYVPARIGANYYWNSLFHSKRWNAFIGLYVKANMGQADFTELSFGLTF
jgi:hypothetical protein